MIGEMILFVPDTRTKNYNEIQITSLWDNAIEVYSIFCRTYNNFQVGIGFEISKEELFLICLKHGNIPGQILEFDDERFEIVNITDNYEYRAYEIMMAKQYELLNQYYG